MTKGRAVLPLPAYIWDGGLDHSTEAKQRGGSRSANLRAGARTACDTWRIGRHDRRSWPPEGRGRSPSQQNPTRGPGPRQPRRIKNAPDWARFLAGLTGLEPATSSVTGWHSNRLSYNPMFCCISPGGWWAMTGSNRRHAACKAAALPTELIARIAEPRSSHRGLEGSRPKLCIEGSAWFW